jgi:hypothetical protein
VAYEYVLLDREARSREYFESRAAAVAELGRIERKHPGGTCGWSVVAYDEGGHRIEGQEWADELLPPVTTLTFRAGGEGLGVFVVVGPEAMSGTAPSSGRAFPRPPRVAKGTHAISEAQTAVG